MADLVQGSARRITLTFTNSAGVATSPTTVVLRIANGSGTTDVTPTPTTTGVYIYDVTFDVAGPWHFEGIGTGVVTATVRQDLSVKAGITAP